MFLLRVENIVASITERLDSYGHLTFGGELAVRCILWDMEAGGLFQHLCCCSYQDETSPIRTGTRGLDSRASEQSHVVR